MTRISGLEPLYSSLAGQADLDEIIQMFVDEIPDRLAALVDRLDASDWDGLRRRAHQLKGAAGGYGYRPISDCAARLEGAVAQREPEQQIRDALDALIATCGRARGGTPP